MVPPCIYTYRLVLGVRIAYTDVKACQFPRSRLVDDDGLWTDIIVDQLHVIMQESQAFSYLVQNSRIS